MDETMELDLTTKQVMTDQVAVTVLGALAGLLASTAVKKGYTVAITAYRLKKNAA